MVPLKRTTNLTVQQLADETLVYDRKRHTAHCLNRTAALVWQWCDGHTSVEELAARLGRELGQPVDEQVVRFALDRLARARLLDEPLSQETAARLSRRDWLRKFGVAAAVVPAVMTIRAPTAQASGSCIPCGSSIRCTNNALPCCPGCTCKAGRGTCA